MIQLKKNNNKNLKHVNPTKHSNNKQTDTQTNKQTHIIIKTIYE